MVGVLVSQLGTRDSKACHCFSPRNLVITVPFASITAKAPPAMSHILGAPKMEYCITPLAVMASS